MVCRATTYSGSDIDQYVDSNWNRDVQFRPSKLAVPDDLPSLVDVIAKATADDQPVHAVGSAWSFEDCAKSTGVMVSLKKLNRRLSYLVDDARHVLATRWTEPYVGPDRRLVHFEAGVRVLDLCEALDEQALAMPTLGGSNGQSLAGALSTGTHGGDWNQPPLHEVVRAVHLVTVGGQEWWIESASNPLTSQAADAELLRVLPCADTKIVRDDRLFDAVRVACGRFGVIYAFVLEVRTQFRVAQVITTPDKTAVLRAMRAGAGTAAVFTPLFRLLGSDPIPAGMADAVGVPYFMQVVFNSLNPNNVWATRRWVSPGILPDVMDAPQGSQHATAVAIVALMNTQLGLAAGTVGATAGAVATTLGTLAGSLIGLPMLGSLLGITASVSTSVTLSQAVLAINGLLLTRPFNFGSLVAGVLDVLWSIPGGAAIIPEVEYMVLNGRLGPQVASGRRGPHYLMTSGAREDSDQNDFRVDSIEMMFDTRNADYVDFLEDILDMAPRFQQAGTVSVRPSLASSALLSMHNVIGPRGVSIEVSTLKYLAGNSAWMAYVHRAGLTRHGRPHWGQYNKVTALDTSIMYGDSLNQWREALLGVSGTSTLFSNEFTEARGLEPIAIAREVTSVKKRNDNITHICNDLEPWSPVPVATAITEIRAGTMRYVARGGNSRALILVVSDGKGGFFLRTQPDSNAANNLDNLPISTR